MRAGRKGGGLSEGREGWSLLEGERREEGEMVFSGKGREKGSTLDRSVRSVRCV